MMLLEPKQERLRPKLAPWRTKIEAFDLDEHSVVRALAISLALHLFLFGTWKLGNHYGVWQRATTPRWLEKILQLPVNSKLAPARKNPAPTTREVPLMFVDVDPRLATAEPPKDTKYFSAMNSRAANRDTRVDSNTPRIEGKQTQVVRTFDRSRPSPQPPQAPQPAPSPRPQKPASEQKPAPEELAAKPKSSEAPGDLAKAKPQEKPHDTEGTSDALTPAAAVERQEPPRTLAEARLRQGGLAGQRTKEERGVKHFNVESSLDVQRSALGDYAAEMIAAVQQRWYDLLDEHHYALERTGKVVLAFRLNQDGTITEMKVIESDVKDFYTLLCQKAVQDPSPYKPWPRALKLDIGAPYKEVKFTFYYN